jgi:hypothetical protein
MDIAKTKREENIAEYVLYIWQLEDLMRALQLSPEAVFRALVAPREATDEWKLAALEWYMGIAELLQKEGKADGGHLDHTLHLIGELNDLHLMLLQPSGGNDVEPSGGSAGEDGWRGVGGSAGRRYRELFSRLAPELPRLRETLGNDEVSDIELAFRALYAAMLYRMKAATAAASRATQKSDGGARQAAENQADASNDGGTKKEVADEVVALVSPVIATLSDLYHKVERGEIDLYATEG